MEYAYAALMLNENDEEINETNLKAVLSAAGSDVVESRVKALVAALEDVDLDRMGETETGTDAEAPIPAGGADAEPAVDEPDTGTDDEDGAFDGLFEPFRDGDDSGDADPDDTPGGGEIEGDGGDEGGDDRGRAESGEGS